MADILKAMDIEQEYLKYKLKNEEPFNLVDRIEECGFISLEHYFEKKKQYQFNQLNFEVIQSTPSKCISVGMSVMETQKTSVVFVDDSETFVFVGNNKPYNKEYCESNNISIYPLYTNGGTIVGAEGDFSFGICTPVDINIDARFLLRGIKNILARRIPNVTISGNDILVDGYKVIATTNYSSNNMNLFITHVSFSDRYNLIKNICHTDSEPIKIPSYIKDMTRDEFKQEVKAWLNLSSI